MASRVALQHTDREGVSGRRSGQGGGKRHCRGKTVSVQATTSDSALSDCNRCATEPHRTAIQDDQSYRRGDGGKIKQVTDWKH